MRSQDIRERFLQFFERRGHLRLPNASLIPHNDPALLFTVAGMVPIKPYLSGQKTPPRPRLTSCQKCFRGSGILDDISSVGDSSHHTFFEMLGNWSIGDYFKADAIGWAWELLTNEFGLDPKRLWPSIYPEDVESLEIWTKTIGVPEARIARLDDNWWAAGPTGPCGYDSEIYWDLGGPCTCGMAECRPQNECGGDRWVEIWNLVFMEFDQQDDGTRVPLPGRCVDTGMGLERMTTVLQGVRSAYETELFAPIVAGFRARCHTDVATPESKRSLNVLADHLRGAAFLIADGVFPSNEGRGYVLRRVIRRAAMHGRRLSLRGGLTAGVVDLVAVMGSVYSELAAHQAHIEQQLMSEEVAFARTIEAGIKRLDAILAGGGTISGIEAFRLYDTYGLPIELTEEMAQERGLAVDRVGFDAAMAEQRTRSKSHAKRTGFEGGLALPSSTFVGYESLDAEAVVTRVGQAQERGELFVGEEDIVVIDPTPFYAEKGGQVGDTGRLTWDGGSASVLDATYPSGDESAVLIRVDSGSLAVGQRVHAAVDGSRRDQIARHHSATHLLHKALREILGDSAVQRGSLVAPDHTTFDFSFARALTPAELLQLERHVNAAIRSNYKREVSVLPIAQARQTGAMAMFGEKYGAEVRVVDFESFSREVCGGTHVERTGDLGAAIIASESSIGQGIRRIEMRVGDAAEHYWETMGSALRETARQLKVRPDEVPTRVTALQAQLKKIGRDAETSRRSEAYSADNATVEELGGRRVGMLMVDAKGDAVVGAVDRIYAEKLGGRGVAIAIGCDTLVVKVDAAAAAAGLTAGDLVRVGAEATGGRGGGRRDFARGAVKDVTLRNAAMTAIRAAIASHGGGS